MAYSLKFGDTIYLYGKHLLNVGDSNTDSSYPLEYFKQKNETLNGFLSTKGFTENSVFFQSAGPGVSFNNQRMENLSNSRDFLFIITPKMKFDFQRDYEKTIEEMAELNKAYKALSHDEKIAKKKLYQSFESKVIKARERAYKEAEINENKIRLSCGRPVTYGQEIQLLHRDSLSYLSSTNECSDTEQIGYKLEMNKIYNSKKVFQILPRYKSRQMKDAIQYNDEVTIQNIKFKKYLCVSDSQYEEVEDLYENHTNHLVYQRI